MDAKKILRVAGFRWIVLAAVSALVAGGCIETLQQPGPVQACHVWEKVEITLQAKNSYENAYRDVVVWVDLKRPGFSKRCYGFWDGGDMFGVRVLGTAPGEWTWKSASGR